MPIPTWVTGQVLTASDVNNWLAPDAGYMTGTQLINSSTFADVTAMSVTGLAIGTYRMTGAIYFTVTSTGGSAKFQWVTGDTLALSSMLVGWQEATTNAPPGGGGPFSLGNSGYWNGLATNGQGSTLGSNGTERWWPFTGVFTASTGGGIKMQGGATSGSITAKPGTYFELQRIN